MVEHLFFVDGSGVMEDGSYIMLHNGFPHPASGFLPYFNNFFISSIKVSLSGWYLPFNLGIVPSLSS
jgi:hypothetical protein